MKASLPITFLVSVLIVSGCSNSSPVEEAYQRCIEQSVKPLVSLPHRKSKDPSKKSKLEEGMLALAEQTCEEIRISCKEDLEAPLCQAHLKRFLTK